MAIGVPTFVLLLILFLPFFPPMSNWNVLRVIFSFSVSTVPTVAGIIFGYVLLDSFKNKDAYDS